MDGRFKIIAVMVTVSLALVAWTGTFWLRHRPLAASAASSQASSQPQGQSQPATLRLGIIPERDIYEQRKRFGALMDYLGGQLKCPVELATLNTYDAALHDLEEKKIDGAFVGSLAAVLAHDRLGARIAVNPQYPGAPGAPGAPGGVRTYRGMIFVRQDSPILDINELRSKSIAMVRTTMAGNLFPIYTLQQIHVLGEPDAPTFRWVGTHDDAIHDVVAGEVDCGAAKSLRIEEWERTHPEIKLRVLAQSDPVPEMALVLRAGLDGKLADKLVKTLLAMVDDPAGRQALAALGAERFTPCTIEEFEPIYRMAEAIGPAWDQVGLGQPRPRK